MLVSQILTDVRSELVEANASFWSDAELLRLANRAESDFIQKTRLLEGKATLALIAGQQDYALPPNWMSAQGLFISTTGVGSAVVWQRIHPTNLEKESQINQNHPANDSSVMGTPRRYWIWGSSLNLDPIPDAAGATRILMFFKAKPTALASTASPINLDDSLSEAINNFILWKAWKKEQEDDKAEYYRALYEENVKQGLRYAKRKTGDERKRIDIDSGRDFNAGASGFNPFSTPLS